MLVLCQYAFDAFAEELGDLGEVVFAGVADLGFARGGEVCGFGRAGVGDVVGVDEERAVEVLVAEKSEGREGFGGLLLPGGTAADDADGQCAGESVELCDDWIGGRRIVRLVDSRISLLGRLWSGAQADKLILLYLYALHQRKTACL